MNKLSKILLAAALSLTMGSQSMAAFVLNGTRFIYEEGKKNISFEVTNKSDKTYGGQVWVDNTSQGEDVYIVPSPPFFKVDANQKQIIRLMNVNDSLPKDRESLFWLNVQEVPPKPKDTEGNVLSIAMNTQVKLIYRPKQLIDKREDAEKQIQVVNRDGQTWLKNPTPYYFALTGVKENGKIVQLPASVAGDIARFAPQSEVALGKKLTGVLSVEAINDWGGNQEYSIK